MTTPAAALLERAVGWRQGVVSRPHPRAARPVRCGRSGFAAAPGLFATGGTSGGAAFEPEQAERAVIAEAADRYPAARSPLGTVSEPEGPCRPLDEVTDFDRHALYYADHWDEWRALPWWWGERGRATPRPAVTPPGCANSWTRSTCARRTGS